MLHFGFEFLFWQIVWLFVLLSWVGLLAGHLSGVVAGGGEGVVLARGVNVGLPHSGSGQAWLLGLVV